MSWNAALIDGSLSDMWPGCYSLNVAPEVMTEALEAYRVEPATPSRLFAGDDGTGSQTVFLSFANEAEALEALAFYWTPE